MTHSEHQLIKRNPGLLKYFVATTCNLDQCIDQAWIEEDDIIVIPIAMDSDGDNCLLINTCWNKFYVQRYDREIEVDGYEYFMSYVGEYSLQEWIWDNLENAHLMQEINFEHILNDNRDKK